MSYDAQEALRILGSPFETYRFTYGPGPTDFYAWTDSERDMVRGGVTYIAAPIDRGVVTSSGSRNKRDLNISVAADCPILEMFQVYPPDDSIALVIQAGHKDDPDEQMRTIWSGRVMSASTESGGVGEIRCRPLSSATKQAGLRRHYQLTCPHPLYGAKCGADKAAATVTQTVLSVAGNILTFADGWADPINPPKYRTGLVEWVNGTTTLRRGIINTTGGIKVHMTGPMPGLGPNAQVQVILGCNHTLSLVDGALRSDCIDIHNNILNFGGQPWIPDSNPTNTNPYIGL